VKNLQKEVKLEHDWKKKKRRAYRFRQKIKHVKALSKIKKTIKIKEIF
jgi:hypothetical protein